MGGSRTSEKVLLLFAAGLVCLSSLASAGNQTEPPSPGEIAKQLLQSNNLSNETLVRLVFTKLTASSLTDLQSFFDVFINGSTKMNLTTFNPRVRDVILNLTVTSLGPQLSQLNTEGVKLWFQVYLPLFLPSVDSRTFEVISKNITCSSYQEIVKGFNEIISELSEGQTQQVFTFTLNYLKEHLSSGFSCVEPGTDDRSWLENNFGRFRFKASFKDFLSLKRNFKGVDVADLLTLDQLSELAAAIPSQLNGTQDVIKIMAYVNVSDFGSFFDKVSAAIEAQPANYTQKVKSAFLQVVLDRVGPSFSGISDEDFLLWLKSRLRPLMVDLSPSLVTPLAVIGANRSCNSSQEMLTLLNSLQTTFSNNTKEEIYKNIILFLQGPTPLKCYSGGSFYVFLKNSFLGFGFPDVSTLLSLLPANNKSELLNTISPSELRQLLSQPGFINNDSDVCLIFNNYNNNNTADFLETQDVPDDVKKLILPCVWKVALSSNKRSEVNLWFDVRLKNYLRFLTKSLISPTEVQNASCVAFQKLVFFMGNNFTYNSSEFGRGDVYTTIKSYLSTGSGVRCYNPSDPELNSTSWFFNYIGSFVTFITLDDLTSFVSTAQIKVFLDNPFNLDLFNNVAIPQTVTNFYISELFSFNPNFSPIKLPSLFLCSPKVPSSPFSTLNENETVGILDRFGLFCNGTKNPEIAATLASNFKIITLQIFTALGSASSGLTISQIKSVSGSVLMSALSTLSLVTSWAQNQARVIIQSLTTSGFQIDSAASLKTLGSLVAGLLSETFVKIKATELLDVSKSVEFISNLLAAPKILQQTLVTQIISLNLNPLNVLLNVPDVLATEIPSFMLVFSGVTVDITVINKKTWTLDQAVMFFKNLAETTFDIEALSTFVLQGFTCTSVQTMTPARILQLIRASRPRIGRAKVELKESQLTCMYNLIRQELTQNFADYPSDMLLFFNTQNVLKENCRSFFSALAAADFSVPSSLLSKGPQLFSEARTCLGITGLSLTGEVLNVLGNMVCTLDSSYIQNSDPLILEKLKACKSFSSSQIGAMETLLLSGKTQYGTVDKWTQQTLENLGILPLYLSRNIWNQINTTVKGGFLQTFMPTLRQLKTQKAQLKTLFSQILPVVVKRAAGCINGNITLVTISDPAFPFPYDSTQFDLCLDTPALRDNLNAICEKVDDDAFQAIILRKLNQANPSGIPEEEVQMLGSVSRVASLDDISKWIITKIDTLAALMKPEDGAWKAAQSKDIITKYLSVPGNSLGSTELSTIGSNLCSLDISTLKTITADSIRNAKPISVGSCSAEQKKVLYETSSTSFSSFRPVPIDFYNLIKPYLGGALLTDVVTLSTQNINMDVDTFRGLQLDVITSLTVTNVQGLMGNQLRDLKLFENDPLVQTWVNLQLQSELDKLGIGLISNRTDPTTAVAQATASSATEFPKAPTVLVVLLTAAFQMMQRRA